MKVTRPQSSGTIHRKPSFGLPFCGVTKEPHGKEMWLRYKNECSIIILHIIDIMIFIFILSMLCIM